MLDSFARARNCVFDVGQVLLSFPYPVFIPKMVRPEFAQPLVDNLFRDGWWGRMDEGTLTDKETAVRVAACAGVPDAWQDMLYVIEHFHEQMEIMPAAALIGQAKAMGKRVYVLSNYGVPAFERTQARFPQLFAQFDGMIISAREKLCKPDERIYRLLLSRFGLRAEETAFLDDNAENVAAARRVGIDAVQYTGADMLGL